MQNQKENIFSEKFKLLNSQECTEDINWTSSDSSEPENTVKGLRHCNITNKEQTRKRKRKKKALNNLSNLDITIIDVGKDRKDVNHIENLAHDVEKRGQTSPILLASPEYFPPYKVCKLEPESPIISLKTCLVQSKSKTPIKSPILVSKSTSFIASPVATPAVKKQLFKKTLNEELTTKKPMTLKTENFHTNTDEEDNILDRRKDVPKIEIKQENLEMSRDTIKAEYSNKIARKVNTILLADDIIDLKLEPKTEEGIIIEDSNPDDSLALLKSSDPDIVKNIKSYFDNHFSSESSMLTQISVIESLTPKRESRTSDDVENIEIISSMSRACSKVSTPIKLESITKSMSSMSSESIEVTVGKSKKIRYKKDGLAYRLNSLLKKQKANVSLWQHEMFLADNSNFAIPKGEHSAFRIQKVNFNYGCYSVTAVDVNDEEFLIVINNMYIQNMKIATDMILKLYVPYKIVDFKSYKLIISVCKFECLSYK